MKLTTSRNKEYEVDWVAGPTMASGTINLQIQDGRRLPEIAAEFDGLAWMRRESKNEGDKKYEGYSELVSIHRMQNGAVLLAFAKE